MNKINRKNFVSNYCCEDKRFFWPRIKASNTPSVPLPPVIVPGEAIIPTINRYFYIATVNIILTNGATIPANLFSDDNGNPITEFKIFTPNGYANLYINAVMQRGGINTITPDSLIIGPRTGTIYAGTPIIIESLGFSTSVV